MPCTLSRANRAIKKSVPIHRGSSQPTACQVHYFPKNSFTFLDFWSPKPPKTPKMLKYRGFGGSDTKFHHQLLALRARRPRVGQGHCGWATPTRSSNCARPAPHRWEQHTTLLQCRAARAAGMSYCMHVSTPPTDSLTSISHIIQTLTVGVVGERRVATFNVRCLDGSGLLHWRIRYQAQVGGAIYKFDLVGWLRVGVGGGSQARDQHEAC